MTVPVLAPPVAPVTAGDVRRRLRHRWRRWRWPLAVAAAVVVAVLIGLVLLRPSSMARLDPGNAAPNGARALVHVLRDHGVSVTERTTAAQVKQDVVTTGGRATVMVARTDLLTSGSTAQLRELVGRTSVDVVLVEAQQTVVADLGLPVEATGTTPPSTLDARCGEPVAVRAGRAVGGTTAYHSSSATASCYPTDDGATYLVLATPGGGRLTLLGSGEPLTNGSLADQGDAALAVGTLGSRPLVVWWTPTATGESGHGEASLLDLLPRQVGWVLGQLLLVLLVVVLWRSRRLGRLVTEPLPVVVRSVETTLGRAALYRRARARGRAAQVLRAAAGRRIAVLCGLPRTAPPHVVAAVAAGRCGRPSVDVAALLSGPDPADDRALVALARALDSLESDLHREVTHP